MDWCRHIIWGRPSTIDHGSGVLKWSTAAQIDVRQYGQVAFQHRRPHEGFVQKVHERSQAVHDCTNAMKNIKTMILRVQDIGACVRYM